MKVSVANPSIAPHVKQNVLAYAERQQLSLFYTGLISHQDDRFSKIISRLKGIGKFLSRRSFPIIPITHIKSRPLPELLRSVASRKLNPTITDQIWEWSELGFDQWVSKQLNNNIPDVIHTYEHAALNTLTIAKTLGVLTVYEQPSQHHLFLTPIIKEQFLKYPMLQSRSTDLLINEKSVRRNHRRDMELDIADIILCNSTFTKETLIKSGVAEDKIKMIPLGFPSVHEKKYPSICGRPIRFMYAGNQSIRKGTHLLYEAWRSTGFAALEAELWLVGAIDDQLLLGKGMPANIIIKKNIAHEQLMELYREIDVLILPTLADGFGMVVTEAMSQGVPVIATKNSCGPDIIAHNEDGWIIPAGEVEPIVDTMKWIFNNKACLANFGSAAIAKSKSWQWEDYRKALTDFVELEWKKKQH